LSAPLDTPTQRTLRGDDVTVTAVSDLFVKGGGVGIVEASWEQEFTAFVVEAEPRLRRALFALAGIEAADALAEALAYGWEHWGRVRRMANPVGYLYRVGRSRLRGPRRPPTLPTVPADRLPEVEPRLPGLLAGLAERQRVCVVLVHGFGWTHEEVATLLGVSVSTVRNHLARGLERLRRELGVTTRD
jgi:DNA-directed RNA polymerase specialized sigma24 family protein